jgi:hypothetical protein
LANAGAIWPLDVGLTHVRAFLKIYSADTWTIDELKAQADDAGRRFLVIPPADTKRAVMATFGEALEVQDYDALDLDDLNDSLHEFADALAEDGNMPVTVIWQVPASFRADRSFGVICETLQDAESYAGKDLSVVAVCL